MKKETCKRCKGALALEGPQDFEFCDLCAQTILAGRPEAELRAENEELRKALERALKAFFGDSSWKKEAAELLNRKTT